MYKLSPSDFALLSAQDKHPLVWNKSDKLGFGNVITYN